MVLAPDDRPITMAQSAKSVDAWLNEVDYGELNDYVPSQFALDFVNFIKLVDGGESENKTPVVHYRMIDNFLPENGDDTINMCHRGIAKSTLKEYLILYLGVFHELPNFGRVPFGIYVSDSIDNGVKKMRKSLEFRYNNSPFLQQYIPKAVFTDTRWEFTNQDGQTTVFSGYGAKTGVRGTREEGSRPVIALLDDLVSDEDAQSPTIIAKIEDTINKAIDYALHPQRRKIIWSGTPFNEGDPLYKAVESGAWQVNVYPVCEQFPCSKEEFRGSWEDRFPYEYVKKQYEKSLKMGKLSDFYQELMLRITSEEDRVIDDTDIRWYDRNLLLENIRSYNIYITTDFATSDRVKADYSVIMVWAINSNNDWFLIDGVCKRQLMDKNIDDLFTMVRRYSPVMSVGVEVSGQQNGFIPWIEKEMLRQNCWFDLASENNSKKPGIRPNSDKFKRFKVVEPWFKLGKMHFPKELENSVIVKETVSELRLITREGIKAKHDDCIDGVSQLGTMKTFAPLMSTSLSSHNSNSGYWAEDDNEESLDGMGAYTV